MPELFAAALGGMVGWGDMEHPRVGADAEPGSGSGDVLPRSWDEKPPFASEPEARGREVLGGTCGRTEAEEQENGSRCWRQGGNKAGVGG